MNVHPEDVVALVERLYAQEGDPSFEDVLIAAPGLELSEEKLADAIDADGRARLDRGLEIPLERYLDSIPGLTELPIALDAAVEFALRGLTNGKRLEGVDEENAVDILVQKFPDLEIRIRTTSLLNEALFATWQTRRPETFAFEEKALPCDYGPVLPDGRSRYELRTRLGRGAHGAVYLAVDRHLSDEDRPAYTAIKILSTSTNRLQTDSIRAEAVRARRVNHPHVVRVLDRGHDDDGHGYIVYEYVDGMSLRSWLNQQPSPPTPRQAARLVMQIARGVQAAHAAGVVHCDLKPDNILMAKVSAIGPARADEQDERIPKVTDFGIAVYLESARNVAQRNAITAAEPGTAVWGSLGFLAPEQFRGEETSLAPPADVYALGGVLYHMLTGRIPNGQSKEDVRNNLQLLEGQDPADRRGLRFDKDLDSDLEAVCRRALAMEVDQRYASAEALATDLERWLHREPLEWTKPTAVRKLTLFAYRQPLACLLLAAMVFGAGGIGGGIVHWRAAERHRFAEVQIESARRLEQQAAEWYERFGVFVSTSLNQLSRRREHTATETWLTTVIGLEALFAQEGAVDAADSPVWSQRLETVREIVEEDRGGNADPSIIPLFWESALGFWLLKEDEPSEARRIFERNSEAWAARSRANDPWLEVLDLLHACAVIQEHFHEHAQAKLRGEEPPLTTAELMRDRDSDFARAVAALEREEEVFRGFMAGGTAHREVLRVIHDLYGPDRLNEPRRQRQAADRFRDPGR